MALEGCYKNCNGPSWEKGSTNFNHANLLPQNLAVTPLCFLQPIGRPIFADSLSPVVWSAQDGFHTSPDTPNKTGTHTRAHVYGTEQAS